MNIYSIKEIVEATNNILNPKEENKISNKSNTSRTIEKKEIFKKPLILKTEVSEKTDNFKKPSNFKFSIKPEIKDNMISEIYLFLKKKVKKNTLKVIIDEQIEIRNLENTINFLKKNKDELIYKYEVLNSKYKFTLGVLDKANKKNGELMIENNDLKISNQKLKDDLNDIIHEKDELIKQKEKSQFDLRELELKNRNFVINNSELKNTISRYINNSKKISEKLNSVENSKNLELEIINKKVKFYQDENVRLSGELLSIQRKNENIKINLTDIELEKEKISNKIKELNKSIEQKNNVVSTTFAKKNYSNLNEDMENLNDKEQKSLDEVISRIFNKI